MWTKNMNGGLLHLETGNVVEILPKVPLEDPEKEPEGFALVWSNQEGCDHIIAEAVEEKDLKNDLASLAYKLEENNVLYRLQYISFA